MIKFTNVSAGYEGHMVLRDISLEIKLGGFYFLTGPSGAGKSTFLRMLSLDLPPASGKLELFGQDVSRIDVSKASAFRRRIGIVLQDSPMLNHLSVWHNVALPLLVLGKREKDFEEDVTDLLEWVGLREIKYAPPATLSGGERQRAGIARAVIGKPELLLADEPITSVDPSMARRLLRLFVELNRLGTAVIIATHDPQLMRQFKAPRLEIERGRIKVGQESAEPSRVDRPVRTSERNG